MPAGPHWSAPSWGVPVIALDEPARAMEIPGLRLGRFRGFAKGLTALLITLRFTLHPAILADEIHVMEDGRMVESGCTRN